MSKERMADVVGPIIRWLDYGAYEGWHPTSFPSVRAALEADRYDMSYVITRQVAYEITEAPDGQLETVRKADG